jgi:23S rRNA (guanosine2251-2'-O)-methyltransferase
MSFKRREKRHFSEQSPYFIEESYSVIRDYLHIHPKLLQRVFCSESNKKDLQSLKIEDFKIPVTFFVDSHPYSSAKLFAEVDIKPESEETFLDLLAQNESSTETIVMLDHIHDPRNLGAIARTCGFFGVKWLVFPKDRQVGLTHASVGASQGGFAVTTPVQVTNLSRILVKLKDLGYWVVGTHLTPNPTPWKDIRDISKKILILGNEEKGLSPGILKHCDFKIHIPSPSPLAIQSLNVSVAAGIVFSLVL